MPCKVALLISTLGCGGAERAATLLADGLHQRGFGVSILTLSAAEEPFYPLASGVEVRPLGLMGQAPSLTGAVRANARRVGRLAAALRFRPPDVLVTFMTETNVLGLLASRVAWRAPCRVVVSEHSRPDQPDLGAPWRALRRLLYPLADVLVTCSRGVASWFNGWMPSHKLVPIYNPVVLGDRSADPAAEGMARSMAGQNWVLAMGRLVPDKGYDLLLEAFARVPQRLREGWRLGIIGEGPDRARLAAQIGGLELRDQAFLLGRFADPYPLLRAGQVFAFSSRWEGFGIALAEAMACGMAPVAFNCSFGPAEIIRDDMDGLLVPAEDVPAFSRTLARLMGDRKLRERLGAEAPEVLRRFSLELYLSQWQRLIESLVERW